MKSLGQDSQCPSWDSNSAPPEYKSRPQSNLYGGMGMIRNKYEVHDTKQNMSRNSRSHLPSIMLRYQLTNGSKQLLNWSTNSHNSMEPIRFTIAFTRAYRWYLRFKWTQSTSSCLMSLWFILILYSHLYLGLPCGLIFFYSSIKILSAFFFSPMCATWSAVLTLLVFSYLTSGLLTRAHIHRLYQASMLVKKLSRCEVCSNFKI
jgi:hypothetical protein